MKLDVPEYFLDILSALLSSITLIGDQFSGIVDEIIKQKIEDMFSREMSEEEIYEKIKNMTSEGTRDPFIIFANEYYENDGSGSLKEASEYIASEFESFIKA